MTPPPRILFVDDEPNVLRAVARLFLDEEYELLFAGSAEEGLELLRDVPDVRVVVSDYRMPGMDGISFLREVGARWPDTVRLVLSGYADTALVVSAINEGRISRFIAKPWEPESFRHAVAEAVDLHRRNVRTREREGMLAQLRSVREQIPPGVAPGWTVGGAESPGGAPPDGGEGAVPPTEGGLLCVDDEEGILDLVRRLLGGDHPVATARSGAEGLEALERLPGIRVVLADYRMPGMDGIELLRQVAARWPDKIRIVISGHAEVAAVVSAINEGKIHRLIEKPWHPEDLLSAVGEAFARYEELRRARRVREELDRILDLLARMPAGVVACSEGGGILFRNRAAESMIGKGDALPPPLADCLPRLREVPELSVRAGVAGRTIAAAGYRVVHEGRTEAVFLLEEERDG